MPFPDEGGGRNVQLIRLVGGQGLERWYVEDLDGCRTMSNDKDVSVWNAN